MAHEQNTWITVGRVSGAYGIKGWIKIHSYTDPIDNLLGFKAIWLARNAEPTAVNMTAGRVHGKSVVMQLEGCQDRTAAEAYKGMDVLVLASELPELSPGDYYWSQLVGLNVQTLAGVLLGQVVSLMETGANDVLVVKGDREHLIPYLPQQVVHEVDLTKRLITVDWDPDF